MEIIQKYLKIINAKKIYITVLLNLTIMCVMKEVVYASQSKIEEWKKLPIIKGILVLASDITSILIFVEPTVAVVLIGVQFFKMHYAEDEQEERRNKKNIKKIIIVAGCLLGVTGIVNLLTSYFK